MTVRSLALVHLDEGRLVPVEPDAVYLLEAKGDATRVRRRGARALLDHRPLGEVLERFSAYGFVRIHRSHAINIHRVQMLRRRDEGPDWEVKLEPPVNRVLPVARGRLEPLLAAFGEPD